MKHIFSTLTTVTKAQWTQITAGTIMALLIALFSYFVPNLAVVLPVTGLLILSLLIAIMAYQTPSTSDDATDDVATVTEDYVRASLEEMRHVEAHAGHLQSMSGAVNGAADEINTVMMDMVNEITSQKTYIADFSEQMDRIDAMIQNLNAMIEVTNDTTENITSLSNNGKKQIDDFGDVFQGIISLTEQFASYNQELFDKMKAVTESLGSIEYISNQTNLLALNASIEAARAGEHGKGFGVVAQEIRKLSNQVKESADSINDIVNNVHESIRQQEESYQRDIGILEVGREKGDAVVQIFDDVITNIHSLHEQSQQMEQSSQEVERENQKVVAQMSELNDLTGELYSKTEGTSGLAMEQQSSMMELDMTATTMTEHIKKVQENLKEHLNGEDAGWVRPAEMSKRDHLKAVN
ncbi:hypothetical protein N781_02215 [Pontibacillus halophilus JSM 076056 = DSM 19796]|uniref:Methyl-accepting transducer domain-containing protein n=1 Tax=Pontibacillus halophilus JSM 076056 = DSM 19796 TaxID=1385510 RepID=A0A0A5IE47_9BACI|nr:methyl-accepting chemotaxis protein [Pontibacillus halophilus]KGX94107.1 hypothetical protein N781_02215 [Pontibacillus halophilus JSM 076056 = DSM 19796]